MRLLAIVILAAALGCGTLNSEYAPNRASSEQPKCCGCDGMESCGRNPDGSLCCTPSDCKCKEITKK